MSNKLRMRGLSSQLAFARPFYLPIEAATTAQHASDIKVVIVRQFSQALAV